MGSRKPTRSETANHEYAVRLTIAVRGNRHDIHNRAINRFLNHARWPYHVVPCRMPCGRKAVYLYLPHIGAAMEVMLHCPEFGLLAEPYLGPMR
ncbi:hypothetical protein [uncultured Jannaschia sp.]|uniref:hypothetical protein n=1 Tax=uncultured Jannaschia sp. TaxID=293347 RepID=UPI0026239E65|nr:hypothetical protein [uncultured Jannaschia sp.]